LAGRDVEEASVKGWPGEVETVVASGFPTGLSFKSIGSALRLMAAFSTCRRRMRRSRPDVALGMGSYASVAPVLAARSLGVPVVLHEANAIPGRAISLLSGFADVVGVAFQSATGRLRHADAVFTGFPLRREISGTSIRREGTGPFTLLVVGGSQGAHDLNLLAIEAEAILRKRDVPLRILHLTGQRDEKMVRDAYRRAGVDHEVHGFLHNMKEAYARADLAVARAGAATCAELAVCGVPALLVPLPSATHDHQTANATDLAKAGVIDYVAQQDLTPERLSRYIQECIENPAKLSSMREALISVAVPNGAERLADLVERTVRA